MSAVLLIIGIVFLALAVVLVGATFFDLLG